MTELPAAKRNTTWLLWYGGYPEQALARMPEALALVQETSYPADIEEALDAAAIIHQLRGEGAHAHACLGNVTTP
jgi:hypothetical protein